STRSSFHSTICVLEGLLEYERAVGSTPEVARARRRGEAYLLERGLFRRRATGAVVDPSFLSFAFPSRCLADVLRAPYYPRDAGVGPDPGLAEAGGLGGDRRQPAGTWLLDRANDGPIDLPPGEAVGEPSRWNTLRALRVLRWHGG